MTVVKQDEVRSRVAQYNSKPGFKYFTDRTEWMERIISCLFFINHYTIYANWRLIAFVFSSRHAAEPKLRPFPVLFCFNLIYDSK